MKISAQYIRPVNYTQNTKRTFTTQYGIQKKKKKKDLKQTLHQRRFTKDKETH